MRRFFTLLILSVMFPALVWAQAFPDYENTLVNDYAEVLDDALEARLKAEIQTLRDETGVQLTILTILTRSAYSHEGSFEDFATGLFNHWGVGDAEKNDGILVLVITEDRQMRIELGDGYTFGYSNLAGRIIDNEFIPNLSDGDYGKALEVGTAAIITDIAHRHALGEPAPEDLRTDSSPTPYIIGVFGVIIAVGGLLLFRRRIKDRLTRCPECGRRGMHTVRHQEKAATRKAKGHGEEIINCLHCTYQYSQPYTISRITSSSSSGSSSGGSFGGGSSSGGGASGSW